MTPTTLSARTIYNPRQKDWATFVETTAESGGARSVIDVEIAPGGGNDPHRHLTYAERFEVLEGTLMVRVGRDWHRLEAGQSATAPIGAVHCFRNDSGATARFRVVLEPGHRGFERMLQAGYGLAEDGLLGRAGLPKNPLHTAVLMQWGEIRIAGPIRLTAPLFHLLGVIARRRGVDRELEARYVKY